METSPELKDLMWIFFWYLDISYNDHILLKLYHEYIEHDSIFDSEPNRMINHRSILRSLSYFLFSLRIRDCWKKNEYSVYLCCMWSALLSLWPNEQIINQDRFTLVVSQHSCDMNRTLPLDFIASFYIINIIKYSNAISLTSSRYICAHMLHVRTLESEMCFELCIMYTCRVGAYSLYLEDGCLYWLKYVLLGKAVLFFVLHMIWR